ncbi:MAG: 2-C-methyl-D-erythritol 4-phosphate cytidylyltransferase [Clostridia bacterium]|jgi:2-C-methyl-D-erythritol 4-phosphate cytidylyltransferase
MEPIRAVIASGGTSSRMGGINKLLAILDGIPVIVRTVKAFHNLEYIEQIILVIPKDSESVYSSLLSQYRIEAKVKYAYSGINRRQSVYNGLMSLDDQDGIVLIHDGARPLISKKIIDECIEGAKRYGVCLAASKNTDTIKMADNIMFVEKTLEREKIYNAQTPQAFKTEFAIELHNKARMDNLEVTDDCMIAEHYGYNVKIIESDPSNIKITTKRDLIFAQAILADCD